MAFNYSPKIVTDGLVFYLDAANTKSYIGSGTTWTDLSRGDNSGILNGAVFNSLNGGSISLVDGLLKPEERTCLSRAIEDRGPPSRWPEDVLQRNFHCSTYNI